MSWGCFNEVDRNILVRSLLVLDRPGRPNINFVNALGASFLAEEWLNRGVKLLDILKEVISVKVSSFDSLN